MRRPNSCSVPSPQLCEQCIDLWQSQHRLFGLCGPHADTLQVSVSVLLSPGSPLPPASHQCAPPCLCLCVCVCSINVVIYAAVSVYAGSWRSVQEDGPEGKEIMTHKEAAKFPLVSACVLVCVRACTDCLAGSQQHSAQGAQAACSSSSGVCSMTFQLVGWPNAVSGRSSVRRAASFIQPHSPR